MVASNDAGYGEDGGGEGEEALMVASNDAGYGGDGGGREKKLYLQ
jgi:hypothetical protein